jgi:hypothetical protein
MSGDVMPLAQTILCFSLPLLFILALASWAEVLIHPTWDFLAGPPEVVHPPSSLQAVPQRLHPVAGLALDPERFPDFSPMPGSFADFARMLQDAKVKSGTLICFECGYYNPVGESQCEECGAWVPQTAKARWVYGYGKEK